MRDRTFIVILALMIVSIVPVCFSQDIQTENKIEQLQERIEAGEDSLYLPLGELLLEVEKWADADGAFKSYLKNYEANIRVYLGRGRAQLGKGKSAFMPVEAIKKLFGIDNFSRAEDNFKDALKLDENCIDAYYRLALTYLAKGGDGNYHSAIEAAQSALQRDSNYLDADYVLGVGYQHLRDWRKATAVFKEIISRQRHIAKSMLRLSEVLIEDNKPEEAIAYFYDGISRLRDAKYIDEIYSQVEILMTPEENEKFKSLPLEEKGEFFRRFWKKKDPTPTTEKNERYEVHYARIKYALNTFPDIIPPYYDDRGKIYVKYGEPDDKYVHRSNAEGIRHNESWTYERSIRTGLTFDFVRKGHIYRQVITLQDAAPARFSAAQARALAISLYRDRMGLSESYMQLSSSPNIENGLMDFRSARNDAIRSAPPENFTYRLKGDPIQFFYDASRFKNDEDQCRAEFYFGIPLSQIHYRQLNDGKFGGNIIYTMMIQDSAYNTVDSRTGRVPIVGDSKENLQTQMFLHQENFNLPPGDYRFAVRVENPEGDARQLYTNPLTIRDYPSGKLALSDIQLSTNIIPQEEGSNNTFAKHDLQVYPLPYRSVQKEQTVYIYFEGYNLTIDDQGQTDYTLSYKLNKMNGKRGIFGATFGAIGRLFGGSSKGKVASAFQRRGSDRNIVEYLALDMSNLKAGPAELTLTLSDNQTGQSTEQTISFELLEKK